MSELNHEHKGYRRGDFVSVLFIRQEKNGELSDWWRPSLYMGHDGLAHYVRFTDGRSHILNPQSKIRSEMKKEKL